jgi:hypothetical protein
LIHSPDHSPTGTYVIPIPPAASTHAHFSQSSRPPDNLTCYVLFFCSLKPKTQNPTRSSKVAIIICTCPSIFCTPQNITMVMASTPLFWYFCLLLCTYLSWDVRSLCFEKAPSSRRNFVQKTAGASASAFLLGTTAQQAQAAPPTSVIAEELGYFPVQNRDGELMYVPKNVKRQSTEQAVELAKVLRDKGVTFYGAFWCPHCSRQKDLFGAQAFSYLNYVECSSKGYGYKGQCKNVDGYPTFRDKKGKITFSGERPLEYFAQQVGFTSFDPSLEGEVPMVGAACKLPKR